MALLIIDGYNLIGTQHRDLQAQRDALLHKLIAYRKKTGHAVTVVFDGWKSGSHQEAKSVTGGVAVIYSRLGDRADDVIRDLVEKGSKQRIVVSSDRAVADFSWSHGSIPVPSDTFLGKLEQACGDGEGDYDEARSGSGRSLSKKERSLRRAIAKL